MSAELAPHPTSLDPPQPIDEVFRVDPSVVARRLETRVVVALRFVVAATVVIAWQAASGRLASEFWISSPTAVGAALVALWSDGVLVSSVLVTLQEALVGFAFGALFGILLGIVVGANRVVARVLDPFLTAFYSIPRVALIPLFILWFGIGFTTKVVFTALLVLFPVFMNTLSGVRNVDRDLIDTLRVMGATRSAVIRKVLAPSALVWVFAGLRISVPFALIGAVVAEMFTSNVGLGYLISSSANRFDTAGVFAALFVTTLLGLALAGAIAALEQHYLRWQPSET